MKNCYDVTTDKLYDIGALMETSLRNCTGCLFQVR